jgi:hypothetical protein
MIGSLRCALGFGLPGFDHLGRIERVLTKSAKLLKNKFERRCAAELTEYLVVLGARNFGDAEA